MERECPECHKKQIFKSKFGFISAVKNNRLCRSCSKIGEKNPSFGVCPSYEIRKKISDFHSKKPKSNLHKQKISESLIKSGLFKGEKNPFYNKHHSEKTKKLISDSQKGEKSYKYHRLVSDETRKRMRKAKLEKMEKLGIAPCVDVGSVSFFKKLNESGFNFKPKRFLEIGYYADGYDPEKHIWIEFDTPYHNQKCIKEKDLIRQNNIIKYFEDINKPLNKFIRVKSNKNGDILEINNVYEGNV